MPNVFGILRTVAGDPIPNAKLLFRPENPWPDRIGEGVRSSRGVEVECDASGYFTASMSRGPYYHWIETSNRTLVYVPRTPDFILLADLLGPGEEVPAEQAEGGQNWRLSNEERQLLNATTGGYNSPFIAIVDAQYEVAFETAGLGTETANFRYRGGMLELLCADDNTWHAPFFNDGAFAIAAHGETPVTVDRMIGGVWQIKDLVTGKFRSWFITGEEVSETLAFGQEVA